MEVEPGDGLHPRQRDDVDGYLGPSVKDVVERYYLGVTRFTTSAFMRAKLGDSLAKRAVAPHIFESEAEARADLRRGPATR